MSSEEINPVAEEANVGEGETNNEVGPEDAGPEEGEEVEEAADEAEEPGLTEEQLHEYFSQYDTTASNTIPIANARDVVSDIDGTVREHHTRNFICPPSPNITLT